MRAFVTGATGFVGSFLTKLLVKKNIPIAVLIRTASDPWRLIDIMSDLVVINGDLNTIQDQKENIVDFKPDTIFHLGWWGVSNTKRNEYKQIENVINSVELALLSKEVGCRTFIGLGSQAEYGPSNVIISETTPTRPTTMYGAAKLSAYHLCRQIFDNMENRFVWLRLFSSYGPMDNSDWMIPYLIRTLLQRKKPSLTAGEQQWDYLFVEDLAEAIYEMAINENAYDVFNIGSGECFPLKTIVELIRDMIDPSLPLGLSEIPYRKDQVMLLQADISRLISVTQWKPKTKLHEGLNSTVNYYRLFDKEARRQPL